MSLTFLACPVFGQSWCPPGATWHWSLFGFGTSGYSYETYVGDTVIDGRDAQRIHRSGYHVLHWSINDTIAVERDYFTTRENGDVLLWTDHDGTWGWDTLFRFHAVPGDSWVPPGSYWDPGYCVATVMDTATIVVEGVPLRQLHLCMHDAATEPFEWTSTLTERIGFQWGNWSMDQACIIDGDTYQLYCYADQDISYTTPGWGTGCEIGTGIGDLLQGSFDAYPNPGTTHFTLDLPQGPHTIELYDATGRRVSHQRTTQERPTIHTEHLPSGIYLLRVDDAPGVRWMKR